MHINRLLSLSLIAALAFACQKEQLAPQVGSEVPLTPVQMKAVNKAVNPDQSSIMVFLDSVPSDELLAKWKTEGVTNVKRLFFPTPGKEQMQARFNLDKWYILSLDEKLDCNEAAKMLASEQSVSRIQFNNIIEQDPQEFSHPYSPEYTPFNDHRPFIYNDPMLYQQWHLINNGDKAIGATVAAGADVNVKDAWRLVSGDPELVIAVVDAGLMYTHPDLEPNIWVNPDVNKGKSEFKDDLHGACFVAGSDGKINWTDPKDSGHGTHVGGIIAAVNNNGIGIGSVAGGTGNNDGVKLMGCQIFRNGSSSEDAVVRAFQYAADHGACILQCSFGLDGGVFQTDNQYSENNSAVVDALNYFRAQNNYPALKGGMAIFASGNEGQPFAAYPGALKDNICVTAIGPDYLPASYTNYGPGCNIAAPGGDADAFGIYRAGILSTVPNSKNKNLPDYGWMQGTSMACPNVTGVVALGMAYARKLNKVFTYQEMTDMVLSSVNDLDERMKGMKNGVSLDRYRKQMGTGTIDAWKLLMKIEGTPSVTILSGTRQMVNLADFFGTSAPNLTYLGVEIDQQTREALGIDEDPQVKNGILYITPTKVGSGKVKVTAIAGGDHLGGGDSIGGMEISQEISLIARSFKSSNGGWL